jgi:hypothetical protein
LKKKYAIVDVKQSVCVCLYTVLKTPCQAETPAACKEATRARALGLAALLTAAVMLRLTKSMMQRRRGR